MSTRPPPRRHRPITAATAAGALTFLLPVASLYRIYVRTGLVWPIAYTIGLSGVTFLRYGYDKMQARNIQWRVKEAELHTLELLEGWPGALIAQHYFQHKTRKTSYQTTFWFIVVGWQAVWWTIWRGRIPKW